MIRNSLKEIRRIFLTGILTASSLASTQPHEIAGCRPEDFVTGTEQNEIKVEGTTYGPKCLKVKINARVSIQASQRHPLKAMDEVNNPFAGEVFTSPQERTMSDPGVFGYYCDAHGDAEGDGMSGAILVE